MSEISRSARVSVSPSQVTSELDEEAVVLDMKKKIYYGLEPVGARIWQMIQEPKTVDEIVKDLVSEFEVEEDVCFEDCVAFLNELKEKELVTIS